MKGASKREARLALEMMVSFLCKMKLATYLVLYLVEIPPTNQEVVLKILARGMDLQSMVDYNCRGRFRALSPYFGYGPLRDNDFDLSICGLFFW